MSRNKKYIVITGQIASGKSTLSKLIKERSEDYLVLSADEQINDLYRRGAVLYNVLVNEFGDKILNSKQNISKSLLREVIFLNDENRKKLNELTHPVILRNMVNIAKKSDKDIVFFEIPLLSESIDKLEKLIKISEIWNVNADYDVRFNRLIQRKGITEDIAKKIISVQSAFENENYDVLTVENNDSLDEFKEKVDLFFENSSIFKKSSRFSLFVRKKLSEKNESENTSEEIENDSLKDDIVKDSLIAGSLLNEADNINDISDNSEEIIETKGIKIDDDLKDKTIVIDKRDIEKLEEKYKEEKSEEIEYDNVKIVFDDEEEIKNTGNLKKIFEAEETSSDFEEENKEIITEEETEAVSEKKSKKKSKKKMKWWKKLLFYILGIIIVLDVIFVSAVAYGGKNYKLDYLEEIQKYSNEYEMDPRIVLAIIRVESNFNPDAKSHANAVGLMQVLPETSKHVSKLLKIDVNKIDLTDPDTSVNLGTYYLKYLKNNFENLDTVYAAYNGGIGNVNKWLKDEKYSKDGVTLYNIPSTETREYVVKVNKALKAYEILYGKEFPTKKKKGFSKLFDNLKNTIAYIIRSF